MISRIKSKLNSRRGVSLVLALLLILICTFAGAAALTAASSNAGRYPYVREYQQQYLAVSSAAKLIHDDLDSGNTGLVKLISECIGGSSGEYTTLDLTVTNSSGDLENMNVTVLLHLPDPSDKENIDVIVQSKDDNEYGEYALRFNVKISGNSVKRITDIEQTVKQGDIS